MDQEQAEQQDTAQDMMSRDMLTLVSEGGAEAEDSDEDTGDAAEDSGDEEYIHTQGHITLNHIQNRAEKKKKTT